MSDVKINLLTEKWAYRRFAGGPLDNEFTPQPVVKEKYTHYVFGSDTVNGHVVDVMEYVYRLDGNDFVHKETNGITRVYEKI